jgi:hemolysin activation/secretion protein
MTGHVLAQSIAPDAGAITQQIERERLQNQPSAKPSSKFALPAPAPIKAGEGAVTVKQFRFEGNTTLSTEALQDFLAAYVGRAVTLTHLQEATQAVVDFYAQNGWLASTELPRQDITEGVITIRITEALLGKFQIQGQSKRVTDIQIRSFVERQVQPGQRLSTTALERGLILADELSGVNVAGRLMAGERDGSTDVILGLTDEPFAFGEVSVDNHGSRSTGAERVNGNFFFNSPFGLGDQTNLYLQDAKGMQFARVSQSMPLGSDGWKASVNASHLKYKVLDLPNIAGVGAEGTSQSLGGELSYAWVRTKLRQTNLVLALDAKSYDNLSPTGAVTTNYKTRVASIGLNGNAIEGKALHIYNLTLSSGTVRHDLAKEPAGTAVRPEEGQFVKTRLYYSVNQNLTDSLSFYGVGQGQIASKNLDSSERFYLGGPTGVRAYPNSEGGGSQGGMLNLELRQRLPYGFQALAFYDHGRVQVEKFRSTTSSTAPNTYSLRGAGLGLAWTGPQKVQVKAIWARRLGDNPNPTSTGLDQDGTQKTDRLWVSASLSF